ncbi:MAG: carboxylating nicotinate-nucleotide diphosphorylase, partial [Candidatus Omnitrophica bacterium]|nr:carboxylating nicotinate-nucleotide diphosphorylase [Candidatus Omnitrophota bacterium]
MALDKLDPRRIDCIVKQALVEDIGKGDITTQLTIPKDKHIKGTILANEDCVICGLDVMETVFKTVDKNVIFSALIKEGHKIKKGKVIGKVEGRAQSILSAERVGLNLLSLLSSVATKTREYVEKIEPLKVKISDTRKTIPGLRELQKYAVRVGGGHNHRMGLDEMVLIKDNHIKVIEGYSKLPSVPKGFKIEIE